MYVTAFINVNDVQRRRNEKISSSVNACQSSSNMQASKQRASLDYSELKKKILNLHHKCEEIHQTRVFMNTITVSKTNYINISPICPLR